MAYRLVIDENSVYEIDETCEKQVTGKKFVQGNPDCSVQENKDEQ